MKRPIYTVRVTQIEAFRLWLYGQDENNESWNTEQKVIDTLKGEYTANVKADFGTSGHTIIEYPDKNKTDTGYRIGDFIFTDTQVNPLLKYVADHPYMCREVPVSKLYRCQNFDLIVTGTIDALEGAYIRDNKFKFSSFEMQDYLDSVQHGFYMDMIGGRHFFYDFFMVKGFDSISDCSKAVIEDVESLYIPRHHGMDNELQDILTEFSDWVIFKGLLGYLDITANKYAKILKGNPEMKKVIQLI